MKKLIVSMKPVSDMFQDFKKMGKNIANKKVPKNPHYEIVFESQKDFNRFVQNIGVLMAILNGAPHSIYQLAKITNKDLANIKKLISFFEEIGAIEIEEKVVSGRKTKRPVVKYQKIEFDLNAA